MASERQESALSEVIGFILIIGVIALILSLYLVYVVPAEGRQNEIVHMNKVNDEFNQYKMTIDSLIVNNQLAATIYETFTLSTQQISSSSGSFYSFPLFQPFGSSGTILINSRTDNLTIEADIINQTPGPGNQTPNLDYISSEPDHIYTNFTLRPGYQNSGTNVSFSSLPPSAGILVRPISYSVTNWTMWINATPRVDHVSPDEVNYQTDLTVTIEKNGIITIQDMIIRKGINNNTRYYVDLIDEAYGINADLTYPLELGRDPYGDIEIEPLSTSYGYNSGIYQEEHTLGSVEFSSGNNYFIQQNYYYQMGGVFLEQTDGMVNKITPSITISRDVDNITHVRIDEILINGSGIMGGTTPVQVQSQLSEVITPVSIAKGIANAKWVAITVETDPKAAKMWNDVFNRIRISSSKTPYNVPVNWSTVIENPSSTTYIIKGYDDANATYDVELELYRPYILTSIERVGAVLE
ncbi:MAG TPA: hypothetical protein VMW63_05695 [Methanoregulaceae archaeon]|nr:hypothetical protein [Methanoregulaceae archaeon]